MTKKVIKIANGQGFWGDSADAPFDLIKYSEIDYLTLDYLAEVTMAIMQKQYNNNGNATAKHHERQQQQQQSDNSSNRNDSNSSCATTLQQQQQQFKGTATTAAATVVVSVCWRGVDAVAATAAVAEVVVGGNGGSWNSPFAAASAETDSPSMSSLAHVTISTT